MANFFTGTHRKPTWRKAGRDEGFRIVALRPGQVRRLNRKTGEVYVPKAGWVRFRWSRPVPAAKGTIGNPGKNVRQKAGLNREIPASGWGILVKRLEQKAPGRVQKINPAYTSQCCSACGHIADENRKSQAAFACTACRYTTNADVNAAKNLAAGHAVTARGGLPLGRPANREPQPALLLA